MGKRVGALDASLLQLSPVDQLDVRGACNHTLILGTTGSGKSSGTYKHLILSALRTGAGGLFCTAKPEDAEAIRAYCAEAGRLGSLIDWTGRNGGLNVLAYELARTGNLNDVIDLLGAMMEIVRGSGSAGGKSGEQFWIDAPNQQFRASVPIIYAATGTVRVGDLLAFVRGAPSSVEQMTDGHWQAQSAFARYCTAAAENLAAGPIPGVTAEDCQRAMDYWREFCTLDAKTAGNIRISVTTMLSRFETGLLRDALFSESTIFPELLLSGAILLLNFPVQIHGEDGAIGQKIVKYIVGRVLLTRNAMAPAMRERPVIIGADECQNFLFRDAEFLAQCRSAMTMVVYATQSLPTLYAKVAGDHPHDRAHHLASNFNNIVLHSSACGETNEWFAKKLGRMIHLRQNFSEGHGGGQNYGMNLGEGTNWGSNWSSGGGSSGGQGGSTSSSWSRGGSEGGSDNWGRNRGNNSSWNSSQSWAEQSDWVIEPGFFGRGLKTGGTANRGRISAVWFRAGHCFAATGSNFVIVEFRQ